MKQISRAAIIAVGSEMLTPTKIDTNSLFITEQLNLLGIQVAFKTIVGDVPGLMSKPEAPTPTAPPGAP